MRFTKDLFSRVSSQCRSTFEHLLTPLWSVDSCGTCSSQSIQRRSQRAGQVPQWECSQTETKAGDLPGQREIPFYMIGKKCHCFWSYLNHLMSNIPNSCLVLFYSYCYDWWGSLKNTTDGEVFSCMYVSQTSRVLWWRSKSLSVGLYFIWVGGLVWLCEGRSS